MPFPGKFVDYPIQTAFAIMIGPLVVIADKLLFAHLLERSADFSEPMVLVINAALVSVPFLLLAYRGSKRFIPWLAGMSLTLWLWWHALQKGVAYQRAPDGSGVDMALALLMLVSPAIIGVICVAIDEALRRRTIDG